MKKRNFIPALVFFCVLSVQAQIPKPAGWVNDYANIISAQDESYMTSVMAAVEKSTSIELAVLTVNSMSPYGSIEEFSLAVSENWGIGKKGEDNGLLLVVALGERKVRIEVGYGLEGMFPDGLVGEILDTSVLPSLRNNDYSTGLRKGIDGIAGIVAKDYDVDFGSLQVNEASRYEYQSGDNGGIDMGLIFRIIIFALIFLGGGGRFLWPLFFMSGSGRSRSYRGGFGSFGRGGFGGGGGFSGFGGGSFGGGGASRGF